MFLVYSHFIMTNLITLLKSYIDLVPFDITTALGGALAGVILMAFLMNRLKVTYAILQRQHAEQAEEKRIVEEKFLHTQQELVRVQTQNVALDEKMHQHREDLGAMEKKFELQFENLANKIFDDKSQKFKQQSQEGLDVLLSPLKEKLGEFQKKVDDSFGTQAKEQFALKEQIQMIVAANDKIALQAEGLTNALKGDSKVQGDWGEVMLEKILEDVGLQKGVDYIPQAKDMKLRDEESGKAQRPDIVVNLPDNKHVVIDSKVSLTAYERFFNEVDESARDLALKAHLRAVRARVDELKERRYQYTDKLGTPDFVLMFIPIESAYMLALQQDRGLHQYAWNKGVAIVCPSTLFSSLSTIASLWKLVRQNQNAEEIAAKGGALYDKIAGFVNDMQAMGRNIKTLEKTYDGAMNKLSQGQGNILSRTEKLKELGVKASKSLPVELLDNEGSNTPQIDQSTDKDDDKESAQYG